MQYALSELIFFFFLYSFLGWCLEVTVFSIRRRRFIDPGMLSGPVCPSYGLAMILILLFLPPLKNQPVLQLIACIVLANVVETLSSHAAEKTAGRRMWNAEKRAALASVPGFLHSLIWGAGAMLALAFLQPLAFFFCHALPHPVLLILDAAISALFILDVFTVVWTLRKDRKRTVPLPTAAVTERLRRTANSFGERINARIHIRLQNAYPPQLDIDGSLAQKKVFAQGLSLTKLFWVFMSCSLLGDLIETVFVRCVSGIWMSRSSVLYGPFSIVWGLGAVLLTIVLSPLAEKGDRYVFLGGFLLGGTYEYACSVFTELAFGQVFWDYSNMPLNIGGRTNVLFMFFWGVLSVVWIQILYPRLSGLIERIPLLAGTILTWLLAALMAVNALLSGLAIERYCQRQSGETADTVISQFLDEEYPDSLVEWVWPNMRPGSGAQPDKEETPPKEKDL